MTAEKDLRKMDESDRAMKLECYLFDSHPSLVIKVDIVCMEMKNVCMVHVSIGIYVFVCAPITHGLNWH